jgi:hypothetical protein
MAKEFQNCVKDLELVEAPYPAASFSEARRRVWMEQRPVLLQRAGLINQNQQREEGEEKYR